MANKTISQLTSAAAVDNGDLFEVAHPDGIGGYTSNKEALADIAAHIGTAVNFSGLNTANKNIVGAINELRIGYSTTEHVIGTWVDGTPLYERTFVFTSADMHGTWQITNGFGTLFYLSYGDEISKIWIDVGNSFVYSSTNGSISQTITYPVVLGGTGDSYARACLQRNPSVNDGKMVINFQTLFPSDAYTIKDNLTYVFTFRYTKI